MAKKKDNLKENTKDELQARLAVLSENLRVLHFNIQGSKLKNVKEEAAIKKDIARIMTELNKNK
ncbi:50S ribosomal protein L29 [Candidatus Nomurabacteria bacterium CG22_combo_CG10-13_8_21_14_all_32_8]|uniref:Large ribosomal subunit protein uL29 n=1 Tax=Candidatus Nomurabacteria bacterium CG22_combo_CG10-13_8_21_14_all_32_8 TaxID=1974732 RepID=A0A2H0CH99_9BACT|nr:MAG: 50S ribosomal protein L29 [Candidatus Nomurabacteria bacterium CG22_combo_CG10-13_8_21_14_all_32_8]